MKTVDDAALEANFGSVKGAIGCDEVASIEVDLRGEAGNLRGQCPLPDHQGDSRSFYCYPNDIGFYDRWYCHRCSKGGDAIDLYGEMVFLSYNSVFAMQALAEQFNLKLWKPDDFMSNVQLDTQKARRRAERWMDRFYKELLFERWVMPLILSVENKEERARELDKCLAAAGLSQRGKI